MMTSLFSMFDPCNFTMKTAWFLPFSALLVPMLKNSSKPQMVFKKISMIVKSEISPLSTSYLNNNMMLPLFFSILMMNIFSLIPANFSPSAQVSIIMPLVAPLWLMSTMYFLMSKTNKILSHMTPEGAPLPLIPILVLIETISNLIRPITLITRLVANMTAGHLLIHLLTSLICTMTNFTEMFCMLPVSLILMVMEMSVSMIQSYIMCTLISLFSNEVH